jgi:hypothetical protein
LGAFAVVQDFINLALTYREIGRAFLRYQNDFFRRIGGAAEEHWFDTGLVTFYRPPDYAHLEAWLKRHVHSRLELEAFKEDALSAGLNVRDGRWVFILGHDQTGQEVIYDVEPVIGQVTRDLEAKESAVFQARRAAGTPELQFKASVVPAERRLWHREVAGLRTTLTPLREGNGVPTDARFFKLGQIEARRGGMLSRSYYVVEGANLETVESLGGQQALLHTDDAEAVK